MGGAALFAAAVLLTGLPVSALLSQRHQLSTASGDLRALQSTDRTLAAQSRSLTDPSTVRTMARSDFGLVSPGQKAYVILPPTGSSAAAVTGSGHVPLEGAPVAPGSALSQQLLGLQPAAPAPSATSAGHGGRPPETAAAVRPSSFWGRVVHTLEFWR